jgi:hypothetical protein
MNIHKKLTIFVCFVVASIHAQQPSPIKLVYNPRVETYAVSGVGGGNASEFSAKKSSTSGQIALDFNIAIKDWQNEKTKKNKHTTLTTMFKYNPFLQANYVSGDSIEMRKIAFVDNEFQMFLGFRFTKISEMGIDENARSVRSYFVDASMTPYELRNSNWSLNTGFRNFNINGGLQIGYMTNTDFGMVGFTFSPQVNYIHIYEDHTGGSSFEELNKTTKALSPDILGGGFRLNVQLNDFCFFFESRKYYTIENSNAIPGLTDRAIISFGGIATGTVLRPKTKESKNQ